MPSPTDLIPWLPLGAVTLHLIEEFGIAAANGAFHIWASIRTRSYSPGVVTGCLAYLPLAAFGFIYFWRSGLAGTSVLIQAALIGPAFNIYSAWNHKRRARAHLARSSR
jgi:hypothetical protein